MLTSNLCFLYTYKYKNKYKKVMGIYVSSPERPHNKCVLFVLSHTACPQRILCMYRFQCRYNTPDPNLWTSHCHIHTEPYHIYTRETTEHSYWCTSSNY